MAMPSWREVEQPVPAHLLTDPDSGILGRVIAEIRNDGAWYVPYGQGSAPIGYARPTVTQAKMAVEVAVLGQVLTEQAPGVVTVEAAPSHDTLCASRHAGHGRCAVIADFRVLLNGEVFGDACTPCLADTITGALDDGKR